VSSIVEVTIGEPRLADHKSTNRYNLSKLFQIFTIRKLATIVSPTAMAQTSQPSSTSPITINSLDPCFCKTDLARTLSGGLKLFFKVFEFLFARTAEEGARCIVIAAGSGRETHGGYMRAGKLKEYAPKTLEAEAEGYGDYIWEQLSRRLEQIQPGIMVGIGA
jgi:retinol dehydrogenase-12